MTLRKRFESWQTDTGRTDPLYLEFLDGRYCFNDVQRDWEIFQEIAGIVVAECVAVCEQEQAHWQMQAPGAADGRYDWKADGAEACADALRGLLERDV